VTEFEALLQANFVPLQRFVNFKVNNRHDAEDIIQEVCLTASMKFDTLKSHESFKPWLISIANHKCLDYYRKKAKNMQIPLDSLSESVLSTGRFGIVEYSIVSDTLDALGDKEKQILYLYFFKNVPQEDIAKRLNIPIGTVKSRLHYAKEKFRQHYPNKSMVKGDINMLKIPEILPEYKIEKTNAEPFAVRCEQTPGWMIIPRVGEKLTWGLYEMPSRKRSEYSKMEVVGKAEVHGIEGVEISAVSYGTENYYRTAKESKFERTLIAQLTDTHCRFLAESHFENGVRKLYTFLDDYFISNWGFGEDNCGTEVDLKVKNLLKRDGNTITVQTPSETIDVVGSYNVTIGGKTYETICIMDIRCFDDNIVSEEYIDRNGRTILWRRFNKNDWAFKRYGKLWTEMLPDNERLTINGETYVHWYDCATDYIF